MSSPSWHQQPSASHTEEKKKKKQKKEFLSTKISRAEGREGKGKEAGEEQSGRLGGGWRGGAEAFSLSGETVLMDEDE